MHRHLNQVDTPLAPKRHPDISVGYNNGMNTTIRMVMDRLSFNFLTDLVFTKETFHINLNAIIQFISFFQIGSTIPKTEFSYDLDLVEHYFIFISLVNNLASFSKKSIKQKIYKENEKIKEIKLIIVVSCNTCNPLG